jgi:hypothetical protein
MTIDDFIHRWRNATGTEKANCQLFLTELTELLELAHHDPTLGQTVENSRVFKRRASFRKSCGEESRDFIVLYRCGCVVRQLT